jgi:ABC-type cobalt transport system substrate-binding protein
MAIVLMAIVLTAIVLTKMIMITDHRYYDGCDDNNNDIYDSSDDV